VSAAHGDAGESTSRDDRVYGAEEIERGEMACNDGYAARLMMVARPQETSAGNLPVATATFSITEEEIL